MTRNLENAVRYHLDLNAHFGLRIFQNDPEDRLNDLEVLLEQIDEYKSRVSSVVGSDKSLVAELFPRNPIFDANPNILGLEDDLVGGHVGVVVSDSDLKKLGLTEKKRKKKRGFGKLTTKRAFDFRGNVEFLPGVIKYEHIYELYEKYGAAHELRSYGVDVEREYKLTLANRKMEEWHGLDEFLTEVSFLMDYLAAIFCFSLKIDAQNFRGDPSDHLEKVFELYQGLLDGYVKLRKYHNRYVDLLHRYDGISTNNFSDADIAHVDSVAHVWAYTEDVLYDEMAAFEEAGETSKVEVVGRFLEVIGGDKTRIDSLNETKFLEKEVLEENSLVKIRDMQMRIRRSLGEVYRSWQRHLGVWGEVAGDLVIPAAIDYGDIKHVEIDPDDASLLDEIKEKYLEVFCDEVDVEAMFQDLKASGVTAEGIEKFDMWRFVREYDFQDELENLRLRVFMDHIFWITMGPVGFAYMSGFLKELYKFYLDAPKDLNDCVSIEDYVAVYVYEYSDDQDKVAASERIMQMRGGVDMLSLEPEVRSVVLDVIRKSNESGEIEIADYQLDETQKVLNMRNINAFMKVLGARKSAGSGSHTKYEIPIPGGSFSYTVPKSTVSDGEFYSALLYRNIAYERGKPRVVDEAFVELMKAAFRKIGLELRLKK